MKIVLGVLVILLSQAGWAADPSVDNPKVLDALKQGMQRLESEEYRAAASEFKRAAKLADGPCGDEGFDRAVRETIGRWVFEPATVDGKPISVYYTITTTRTAVGSN